MHRSRRAFLRSAAALTAIAAMSCDIAPRPARRIPRLGLFQNTDPPDPALAPLVQAFLDGLTDLGYVDGRSIQIERRYAQNRPELYDEIAAEYARMPVDVMAASAAAAIRAAKRATSSVPIVMLLGTDPVETGLVQSLARPGVNVTGMAGTGWSDVTKRLELLKEAFPAITRVGVLVGGDRVVVDLHARAADEAARVLRIEVVRLDVPEASSLPRALDLATSSGVDALLVANVAAHVSARRKEIVAYAASRRIPAAYSVVGGFVDEGGLLGTSADAAEGFRRAASFVDRILKGANPAELPLEQPTKFDLVINLKSARELGLTIPQSVLGRATRIIQ